MTSSPSWFPAFLLSISFFLSSAQARVGETLTEIEKRYRAPVAKPTRQNGIEHRRYYNGTYIITVAFIGGKSAAEILERNDGQDFTDEELDTIVKINARSPDAPLKSKAYRFWVDAAEDRTVIHRKRQVLVTSAAYRAAAGQTGKGL
jgi:hypothetical protein